MNCWDILRKIINLQAQDAFKFLVRNPQDRSSERIFNEYVERIGKVSRVNVFYGQIRIWQRWMAEDLLGKKRSPFLEDQMHDRSMNCGRKYCHQRTEKFFKCQIYMLIATLNNVGPKIDPCGTPGFSLCRVTEGVCCIWRTPFRYWESLIWSQHSAIYLPSGQRIDDFLLPHGIAESFLQIDSCENHND